MSSSPPITVHKADRTDPSDRRTGLHRWSLVLAVCTFGLIFAGGSVTSNDAGLAVPDWPTTFGENMFLYPVSKWVGNVFFEHAHRLWGAVVGMVTIAVVVWSSFKERRRWVRRFAWSMLAVVIVQGVLGGLRVTELSITLAIVHGCLAQLFFCATLVLVLVTSRFWLEYRPDGLAVNSRLKWLCLALSVAIFLQLIVGAQYRHLGTGFAYHVLGAVVITLLVSCVVMWVTGEYQDRVLLFKPVKHLGLLLMLQLMLGVGSFVLTMDSDAGRPASFWEWVVPSVHVATGALILAVSVVLAIGGFRVFGSRAQADGVRSASSTQVAGLRVGFVTNAGPRASLPTRMNDYFALGKPRVLAMVLAVAALGFCLADGVAVTLDSMALLANILLGTALATIGANTLNQVKERKCDARMARTANRPVAAGRISPARASLFGVWAMAAGVGWLAVQVNVSCAGVALAAFVIYVFVYTPMKSVGPVALIIGAIPGALPPVIGWTGAVGALDARAGLLFAILFVWQLPHFLSIAWMYRQDYARAGIPVLPVVDPTGKRTVVQLIAYSILLIPISLLPTYFGLAGFFYYAGALVCGFAFLAFACEVVRLRTTLSARQHVVASVTYLPVLFVLMALDKVST